MDRAGLEKVRKALTTVDDVVAETLCPPLGELDQEDGQGKHHIAYITIGPLTVRHLASTMQALHDARLMQYSAHHREVMTDPMLDTEAITEGSDGYTVLLRDVAER